MISRIGIARIISNILPPLISQRLRDYIFPISLASKLQRNFRKRSITGSYLFGNTLDYHGYRFYIHGFFDWRNVIIARAVKKYRNGDIIEVGANVGTETVSYCDLVKENETVHAFEPLPSNLEYLQKLLTTQNRLKLYPIAISDKRGKAKFLIPPKRSSGTGSILLTDDENNGSYRVVQTKMLDDFHEEFHTPSLLFIDTEGHEPLILTGAKSIISKFKPVTIIEASPKLLRKNSDSDLNFIYNYFKKFNYEVYKINRITISQIDNDDLISLKSSNWVCIPKDEYKILRQVKKDLLIRSIIPWFLLNRLY
jgi:FkbM family methyltransferase